MSNEELASGSPLAEGPDLPKADPLRADYIPPSGQPLPRRIDRKVEPPIAYEPGVEYESAEQFRARQKAKGERIEQLAQEMTKARGGQRVTKDERERAAKIEQAKRWQS